MSMPTPQYAAETARAVRADVGLRAATDDELEAEIERRACARALSRLYPSARHEVICETIYAVIGDRASSEEREAIAAIIIAGLDRGAEL